MRKELDRVLNIAAEDDGVMVGEHGHNILTELLGLGYDEVRGLQSRGVTRGTPPFAT